MANIATVYVIQSTNFDYHQPISAVSYTSALEIAKARGWEATIRFDGTLVASWSPLYGTHVYNRELAR